MNNSKSLKGALTLFSCYFLSFLCFIFFCIYFLWYLYNLILFPFFSKIHSPLELRNDVTSVFVKLIWVLNLKSGSLLQGTSHISLQEGYIVSLAANFITEVGSLMGSGWILSQQFHQLYLDYYQILLIQIIKQLLIQQLAIRILPIF
jgi:hypothetical protein